MNLENLGDVGIVIEELISKVDDIQKVVNGLKLNEQRYVVANNPIPPGIGCKFAYDKNGLVLHVDKLQKSDIPELPIDHISGLRKLLDEKISNTDIERLKIQMNNNQTKKGEVVNSGIKINYDDNGLIVSSSDELLVEDIPILPLTKIDGLSELLDLLKSSNTKTIQTSDNIKVQPGSYCKVTYDDNGRVLSGSNLTMNDIPMELITRLNVLESNIPNLASITTVNSLIKENNKKLDANNKITPGVYTKISVDTKGLVTNGTVLEKKDLPELEVKDIINLDLELRSKANQSDFIEISNTVSNIVSNLSKIGDISKLQSFIDKKADSKEVKEISSHVASMQSLMDTLLNKIPNELIMDQLNQIQLELSNLSGRISVIETKLGLIEN